MATKVDKINNDLKELYSNHLEIFKEIPKYSKDYSFPTFINCTPEYAKAKTKALFIDWESAVWYRDRNADTIKDLSFYEHNYPWVYKPYSNDVDGYMNMYSDFIKDDGIAKDINKSKFWSISEMISATIGVQFLFSYIIKSDINLPKTQGIGFASKISKEEREMRVWYEKFELECHKILAQEINILSPNYVFFICGGGFGRGEWSLPKITGSRNEYIPVGDNGLLTFIDQRTFKNTDIFLVNSKILIPSDLGKSLSVIQQYA